MFSGLAMFMCCSYISGGWPILVLLQTCVRNPANAGSCCKSAFLKDISYIFIINGL